MDNQPRPQYSELELLKMQMNKVADDSLESTRRMVTSCDTTERLGSEAIQSLHHQGEQLRGVERNLDTINDTMYETDKNLDKLHKGKGLFGRFKRTPKHFKTDAFNNPSPTPTGPTGHDGRGKNPQNEARSAAAPQPQQGRFITPILNDAREDEMESNLQEVSRRLGVINNIAVDMKQELSSQNQMLDRINTKAEANKAHIKVAQSRADNYLGKPTKQEESTSISQKLGAAAAQAMLK